MPTCAASKIGASASLLMATICSLGVHAGGELDRAAHPAGNDQPRADRPARTDRSDARWVAQPFSTSGRDTAQSPPSSAASSRIMSRSDSFCRPRPPTTRISASEMVLPAGTGCGAYMRDRRLQRRLGHAAHASRDLSGRFRLPRRRVHHLVAHRGKLRAGYWW